MKRVLRWGQSAYETDDDLARERAGCEGLGVLWDAHPDPRTVPALGEVDVLVVTSKCAVTPDVMASMAGKAVLTTTSGYEHLDLEAAKEHGVVVGRCPLARRAAVVEQTIAGLVWGMRQLPLQAGASRDGRWVRGDLPALAPRGIAGSTVAVVGLGIIGKRVTETLFALDADVRVVDPFVAGHPLGGWSLENALRGADAVTLHCGLNSGSRGMLSGAMLDLLPAHAVVVNTSRGEVLDVSGAAQRVRDGRLRSLVVDVFPEEPYPQLAEESVHPAVMFTPHAAGFTHDLGGRVAGEVVRSIRAWQESGRFRHALYSPEGARGMTPA